MGKSNEKIKICILKCMNNDINKFEQCFNKCFYKKKNRQWKSVAEFEKYSSCGNGSYFHRDNF